MKNQSIWGETYLKALNPVVIEQGWDEEKELIVVYKKEWEEACKLLNKSQYKEGVETLIKKYTMDELIIKITIPHSLKQSIEISTKAYCYRTFISELQKLIE